MILIYKVDPNTIVIFGGTHHSLQDINKHHIVALAILRVE